MNATSTSIEASDVARGLSLFDIDQALDALVEAADEEAQANDGEVPEALKEALVLYVEAFGYKVDRIADYLKAQKAEAELAQREADRLYARQKAAESREKRLKAMLLWFMTSRNAPKLRGALNTISKQLNSAPSLVLQETTHIPDSFYRARVDLTWPEWHEIVDALPSCALQERLRSFEGTAVQKELQRGVLSDALARGEAVEGAALVRGSHIRIR